MLNRLVFSCLLTVLIALAFPASAQVSGDESPRPETERRDNLLSSYGLGHLGEEDKVKVMRLLNAAVRHSSGRCPIDNRAIQSQIDGDFSGWEGDSIYKLKNGQVWKQIEYKYEYQFLSSPGVLIFNEGGDWMMKVEQLEGTVRVRCIS